jgi:integrase
MAYTRVSISRKWYGKVPLDRDGNPIPRNLWPKRRKFSWEVRWYGSEGKRYSKSFKDRKEACEHAKKMQEKVDNGRADKPREITLSKFIEEHEKVMVGQVAYSTLVEQSRALKFFSKYLGSDIQLSKITARDAEAFISYRLSQKLAPATVNKDISTLHGIFNLAIEPRAYLEKGMNPFSKIKHRKIAPKAIRYVSTEELSKVLNSTPDLWWKTFLTVAYVSAGRKDELLNLTWADIDFENNNISFVPKKEAGNLLAWEPKDHESRVIPVPEQMTQLLANLQTKADEISPYVFVSEKRLNHILDRRAKGNWKENDDLINNMLRRLKGLCKKAKVKTFCFHDLRRSCITNWTKHLPIHVVQELAGHSNIDTTQKYYLFVENSDRQMARDLQSKVMTKLTNF